MRTLCGDDLRSVVHDEPVHRRLASGPAGPSRTDHGRLPAVCMRACLWIYAMIHVRLCRCCRKKTGEETDAAGTGTGQEGTIPDISSLEARIQSIHEIAKSREVLPASTCVRACVRACINACAFASRRHFRRRGKKQQRRGTEQRQMLWRSQSQWRCMFALIYACMYMYASTPGWSARARAARCRNPLQQLHPASDCWQQQSRRNKSKVGTCGV